MRKNAMIWKTGIRFKSSIFPFIVLILSLFIPDGLDAQYKELIKLSKTKLYNFHEIHELSKDKISRLSADITTNDQLIELVKDYQNLQELHLQTTCASTIAFDSLAKLKFLKILTISYINPASESAYNTCGFRMEPLNLEFIGKIEGLHFFGLNWSGLVLNAKHILSLKNLEICALPSEAFEPAFLNEEHALHQLILGQTVSLLRDKNTLTELILDCSDFSNQFEWANKNYRNYLTWNKTHFIESISPWEKSFVKTNTIGDTIFFISTQDSKNCTWRIENIFDRTNFLIELSGTYQNDTISKKSFSARFEMCSTSIGDSLFKFSWNFSDDNDHSGAPIITQITYKNKLKDREFIAFRSDAVFNKKVYENDKLIYLYPYKDSIRGAELIKRYVNTERFRNEIFYGDSGKAIIRGYADHLAFDDDTWLFLIPLKNGYINGNVVVRSAIKDTILNASFKNGQFHGKFYYRTEGIGDPTTVNCNYYLGQLDGKETKVR